MPVRSALESSGKLLRYASSGVAKVAAAGTPQVTTNPTAPTARDYTTSGLGAAFTVLLVTALHHGADIDLSPEVVAALTTISGFMAARYFRY